MPRREDYPITHAIFDHVRKMTKDTQQKYCVYISRRLHNTVKRETYDAKPHATLNGVLEAKFILGHPMRIVDGGPDLAVGVVCEERHGSVAWVEEARGYSVLCVEEAEQ